MKFECKVMEVDEMKNIKCSLYPFLHAAKGSWRNAVFVECGSCPHGKKDCGEFLMTADAQGHPVLFPVDGFRQITGQAVDREECLVVMKRTEFETLYALWLEWQVSSVYECVIEQLIRNS